MPRQHVASVTDCIASIAHRHGVLPGFIWDHPDNADLRALRGNPNVLLEGDVVTIPDKRLKEVTRATEQRHTFVRLGVPAHIEFRIMWQDQPVANAKYTLTLGSDVREGTTDGQGGLKVRIPPDAITGQLVVEADPEPLAYTLQLGALNPIDDVTGVQQRLTNLGYGVPDDELGAPAAGTRDALARFQRDQQLPVSGEADDETRRALQQAAGQ
jgi:hypothetical protein